VIGHPIGHSLSPLIHNAGYAALNLNFVYLALDVTNLQGCLAGFRAIHGFRGLSVTIPHKIPVIRYLDEVDQVSRKVGSINTISKTGDVLTGTSTDGPGTLRALAAAGVDLKGKRILFLGSGGAVRAVAFAVADAAGPESVRILGRTAVNVEALVNDIREQTDAAVFGGALDSDLGAAMEEADIIIQGTPIGMHGSAPNESVVPCTMLEARHVVFDMVYRPLKTRFIIDAEQRGCKTVLGIEMLLNQAALQFELWTGKEAPMAAMRDAVANQVG
jgi:shikimate dehydrogenase